VPPNQSSSSKSLCEEFRREIMAMFVEQTLAKGGRSGAGMGDPGSFETSMLDRALSIDCGGRETPSP
jgi:hypothetical protein